MQLDAWSLSSHKLCFWHICRSCEDSNLQDIIEAAVRHLSKCFLLKCSLRFMKHNKTQQCFWCKKQRCVRKCAFRLKKIRILWIFFPNTFLSKALVLFIPFLIKKNRSWLKIREITQFVDTFFFKTWLKMNNNNKKKTSHK